MNQVEFVTLINLLEKRNYHTNSHLYSGYIVGVKEFSDKIIAEISISNGDIQSCLRISYDPSFRTIEDLKDIIEEAEMELKEDILYLEENRYSISKEDIESMLQNQEVDPSLIKIIMERLK